MIETGRVCVKLAGRDAGKHCAIVEVLDQNYVMIDGNVRRRKCNLKHLILLDKKVKIKEKAQTEEVKKALKEEGLVVDEKKTRIKPKKEKKAATPKTKAKKEEPKVKKVKK